MRSDRSLADEAGRWRRELREAQAIIAAQNRMLLSLYLRDRLVDPGDFFLIVGTSAVVDTRGAIVWERVESHLAELLERKPHLAATSSSPFPPGRSAVDFFKAET